MKTICTVKLHCFLTFVDNILLKTYREIDPKIMSLLLFLKLVILKFGY